MKHIVKIFIATHKEFDVPKSDIYYPLHVGSKGKKNLNYVLDSEGDNISSKNPYFCELTGLYWIWKNVQADVVGLVHYRRYFYDSIFSRVTKILNEKSISKMLNKHDIIVAQRGYTWNSSVRKQYELKHIKSDLDICEKVLKDKYPEYSSSFDKVFEGDHYCPFNMMICKKKIFDSYCNWLFDILFEIEKKVDLKKRDTYNARVFGFLSERLLNVWLLKNDYNVVEKPVFNREENVFAQRIQTFIKKAMFFK